MARQINDIKEKRKMQDALNAFFGDAFHKNIFFICLFISIGLIITSFFTPPMWVIDGSVLAAVGELFGFAALGEVAAAVEKGHRASITHQNTTIEIGRKDKHEISRTEDQYEEEETEENG